MADEEFQAQVRQRLLGNATDGGSKQRVVAINDVERYLIEGWEFIATLPNDRVILKHPN